MNRKVLKTLEFDKITARLAELATTPMGQRLCLACEPMDELSQIETAQAQTRDALARLYRQGSLSFYGARDIGASLKRLEIGSSLSISELLAIGSLLNVAAQAKSYGRGENLRLSTGRSQDVASEDEETHDCLEAFFTALEPLPR